MKWLSPFFLLAAACLGLLAIGMEWDATSAWLALLAGIAAIAIGHFANVRPFSLLSSAFFSLLGVAAGLMDSLISDKTYTVWDPATSVRAAGKPRRRPSEGARQ